MTTPPYIFFSSCQNFCSRQGYFLICFLMMMLMMMMLADDNEKNVYRWVQKSVGGAGI